ncbi:MAG: hypothetical protein PHD43_10880 [Methylococcales bacterium]|nr:hypothetical protein [Methylococcales bacterium]
MRTGDSGSTARQAGNAAPSATFGWLYSGLRPEIVEDFPELTDDDITVCLQFAADWERQSVTIKAL